MCSGEELVWMVVPTPLLVWSWAAEKPLLWPHPRTADRAPLLGRGSLVKAERRKRFLTGFICPSQE